MNGAIRSLQRLVNPAAETITRQQVFDELFAKIDPKRDSDLLKFKPQIKEFLENEIVGRYYYQTGRSKNALREDPCIKKSLEVFASNYNQLLAPVETKK